MPYYDVLSPAACRGEELDIMLSLGWYPMGQTIFTTSHLFSDGEDPPQRVHWLRYPVGDIRERTSHRRIRRRNREFSLELADPFCHRAELDRLYETYLNSVDFDGYPTIAKATCGRGGGNIYDSKALVVRDGDRLAACGIFHRGARSAASVLHFYDPAYKWYSPGKFLILSTLDYCRSEGIDWYYPGYVIEGNPKMDYKLFLGEETVQYYLPEPSPLRGSWQPYR
jgi:leucyl-tRNA---protein transferase